MIQQNMTKPLIHVPLDMRRHFFSLKTWMFHRAIPTSNCSRFSPFIQCSENWSRYHGSRHWNVFALAPEYLILYLYTQYSTIYIHRYLYGYIIVCIWWFVRKWQIKYLVASVFLLKSISFCGVFKTKFMKSSHIIYSLLMAISSLITVP